MPASQESRTYGAIRAAPAAPSQSSLCVLAQMAVSSAGHGIAIATAARACEATTRPGDATIGRVIIPG